MNIVQSSAGQEVFSKNGVTGVKIMEMDEAKVVHMTIEGGGRVETHTTPINVFFYILEGKAWVEVGDERIAVEKDSIVESPKGIPHGLENFSKTEVLRVMVCKLSGINN